MPYLVCSRCGLVVYSAAGLAASAECVACQGQLEERDSRPTPRAEPGITTVNARAFDGVESDELAAGRFRRIGKRIGVKGRD